MKNDKIIWIILTVLGAISSIILTQQADISRIDGTQVTHISDSKSDRESLRESVRDANNRLDDHLGK